MKLYRIGEKVVSLDKLVDAIERILEARERGSTQEQAALSNGVQRSFVSFVESLGEIRRGPRVALVGFPIANAPEVRAVAESHAVDFVLVFSQAEREVMAGASAADVFNRVLETLAELTDYDVIVLMASDWRIRTVEKILGRDVIGLTLGPSPITEGVSVDAEEVGAILGSVMAAGARGKQRPERGVLRMAADAARRWTPSKK